MKRRDFMKALLVSPTALLLKTPEKIVVVDKAVAGADYTAMEIRCAAMNQRTLYTYISVGRFPNMQVMNRLHSVEGIPFPRYDFLKRDRQDFEKYTGLKDDGYTICEWHNGKKTFQYCAGSHVGSDTFDELRFR